MSFKKGVLYPCAPTTTRGASTKLSASGEKLVYTNGKTVIIRDLSNPHVATAYSQHTAVATVARISPSGYYVASADASGTVRIWDIAGADQTLKGEYKVLGGKINDLAWDGESKRIIAVGDGRDKFGHVFMFDTGSSAGEIIGHNKPVNAVAIRAQRPFRAVTAGDDGLLVLHTGAPYKYDKTIRSHTRFVQDVQYAPSGAVFASAGADAKIFLYDGTTGEVRAEFSNEPHTGSVFGISWSTSGDLLGSASADGTVKLWDAEAQKCTHTWILGSGVGAQQVGVTFTAQGTLAALALSGDLALLDARAPTREARILTGPQKSVTAGTLSSSTFFTGSYDGRVLGFSLPSGEAKLVNGGGHGEAQIVAVATSGGGRLFTAAFDDTIRAIDANASAFGPVRTATKGQPRALSAAADFVFATTATGMVYVLAREGGKVLAEQKVAYTPGPISASEDGKLVAVGGDDNKVYLYAWDGSKLAPKGELTSNKSVLAALAFAPGPARLLAAGDSSGKLVLYDVLEQKVETSRWAGHTARIQSLAWTADGKYCASCGIDTHVYIWSVAQPVKNIAIRNAAPGGASVVQWAQDHKTLVVSGHDACVRTWEIALPA